MTHSIITSAEKKFVYISNKVEIVAKQALILLAETISKLVFRIQFFLTEHPRQEKKLINQVSNALGQTYIWNWTRENDLRNLGLRLIDDFYFCVSNQGNVSKAFRGTWEILKIKID
ncbi:MAG: hypothetical protein ACRCSV_00370 [Chlamydiales bacterium]